MKLDKVFITGASGCVGHYVVDQLKEKYELFLLLRNPQKMKINLGDFDNIKIIEDDLDNISRYSDLLAEMDYCIHIATAWGGEHTERINVQRVHELFNLLNSKKIKRVIYFSTASILGTNMELLKEAELFGTDYIKTKSICYQGLSETKVYEKITTVFPTLVFGGDDQHSYSSITEGIPKLKKFAWLVGRIKIDMNFHFIHAEDIAKVVEYLMNIPDPEKKYVIGNTAISFGEFSKRAAEYYGYKIGWQIKINPNILFKFLKIIRADISDWDQFCMEYKDFVYPVINCETIGKKSNYNDVEDVIAAR